MTDGAGENGEPGGQPRADGAAEAARSTPATDRQDGDSTVGRLYGELTSVVRFGQFASVGVVGAVFDNSVLATLKLAFGVPEMWAKAAGIETAILVMFLANEHWTFSEAGRAGRGPLLRRLTRSHLVRSGGVAVQLVVYWVLTQRVPVTLEVAGTDLWFLAASPIAIAVAMVVNYVAESLFTWRVHR